MIVIEETSEIHLNKPNVLRLEARRAQAPLGQEAPLPPVTIADLLRASLRHRPDRILVGEVRGAEAFDLLQALNTGHLGSMSTIHANSSEQALTRLAHCVLTANVGLPHRSTREAIALAIQVVAHIARVDGTPPSDRAAGDPWIRRAGGSVPPGAVSAIDVPQTGVFVMKVRTALARLSLCLLAATRRLRKGGESARPAPRRAASFLEGTWSGTLTIRAAR